GHLARQRQGPRLRRRERQRVPRADGAPVRVARAGYFDAGAAGRRNTTGESAGTLKGVADFGSESNLENVVGFSLKWLSSVVIRVVLAGWSESSCGSCFRFELWKSRKSQGR